MDVLESGSFPPNVTLPSMNGSYLPSAAGPKPPMMMYSQQPASTHAPHHPATNGVYRSCQQPSPQPMYNNFSQSQANPAAGGPGYYPMPQAPLSQQRMSPANHHPNQLVKRQTYMPQQQRISTPMNQQQQQLQLHMSMNVTLPHVNQNLLCRASRSFRLLSDDTQSTNSSSSNNSKCSSINSRCNINNNNNNNNNSSRCSSNNCKRIDVGFVVDDLEIQLLCSVHFSSDDEQLQ